MQNSPQKFLNFIKVCLNNIGIEMHVAIKQFKIIICTAPRFCIERFVGKIIKIKRSIEIAVNVRVEKHNEAPLKKKTISFIIYLKKYYLNNWH